MRGCECRFRKKHEKTIEISSFLKEMSLLAKEHGLSIAVSVMKEEMTSMASQEKDNDHGENK